MCALPICFRSSAYGFTLVEILIALFIFAIVSSIVAVSLRTVIDAQSGTERSSTEFRNLEMAWIIIANDIEQAVNRPIFNAEGREEAAFIGAQSSMTFTHMGWRNPHGKLLRSTLQRTRYQLQGHSLLREIWSMLDQGDGARPSARPLLQNVASLYFQYLDDQGRVSEIWPVVQQAAPTPLPRAVRVILALTDGRKMSQLYVIPR